MTFQQPLWLIGFPATHCLFLVCLLYKTHLDLNKTMLFFFFFCMNWPIRPLPNTLPTDFNKDVCPRSCLSLSALCLQLPVWPLSLHFTGPPGPVKDKFVYFNFLCGQLLHLSSLPGVLCSTNQVLISQL